MKPVLCGNVSSIGHVSSLLFWVAVLQADNAVLRISSYLLQQTIILLFALATM